MSLYVDRKYLLLVSPQLERFTSKNDDLFNFRCPFCGDSKKNKLKTRGYIYKKGTDYFYTCHNCGIGFSFLNFLNTIDSSLASQYKLEKFVNRSNTEIFIEKPGKEFIRTQIELPSIMALDDEHYAKHYVKLRKIPEKYHSEIYYASNFKMFVKKMEVMDSKEVEKLADNDPRLIIPFYNKNKELIYFQGRSLFDSKIRYITISVNKNYPKLFGMDKININYKVYVVEGPIDSMFLNNSIATADSDLTKALILNLQNYVLIYDNQPRNLEIVKKIEKSILQNHKVCLLPESNNKDINDMILSGLTTDEVKKLIDSYTFQGLRARLEFNQWRKV